MALEQRVCVRTIRSQFVWAAWVAVCIGCRAERVRAPTAMADSTVDAAERRAVIDGVLARLRSSYVWSDGARAMDRAIRARMRRGAYDSLTSARVFAESLTAHLRAAGRDNHVRVEYRAAPLPRHPWRRGAGADVDDSARARGRRTRFGIGRPRRLSGNVAYLEIRSFGFPAAWVEPMVTDVMRSVADADALIIDLRRNGGGSPRLTAFVSSYVIGSDSVHLATLYWRRGRVEELWATPDVPGVRYGLERPVYVLTSRETFSAAEGFAYNLQARGRVVVVGDTTGGGAHAGGLHRVADHFGVWVPAARPVNPVTGTNWERVGVRPDIAVTPDAALRMAHLVALGTLLAGSSDSGQRADLEAAIVEAGRP